MGRKGSCHRGNRCCRVVIIDGPDSWAKTLVGEKVIEKFYPVDFTDEAAIFDKCLVRIKQAEAVSLLDYWNCYCAAIFVIKPEHTN